LRETLSALADDMEFAAVHIGMLASGAIAAAVADFLQERKLRNVIVDPILKSSSGTDLIDEAGVNLIKERLFPLATAITPNTHEAAVLTNLPVTSLQEMKIAAGQMHLLGAEAVIITGGHLKTPEDLLSVSRRGEVEQQVFSGEWLESRSTHGTGCAFATALACQLALGQKLDEAVSLAKTYVMESIAHAYPVGKGIGPVNHLYAFHPKESKTKM
jgi:hydroxymethylpyrimidine/phosphomethylpyrimidine kinase